MADGGSLAFVVAGEDDDVGEWVAKGEGAALLGREASVTFVGESATSCGFRV